MRRAALLTISILIVVTMVTGVQAQTTPTLDQRVADLEARVVVLESRLGIVPSPTPSPSPTTSPSPSPSPTPSTTPSPTPSPGAYPPPSTETTSNNFRLRCAFSHRAQVDPIVAPGPTGTLSAHVHDFFGNRSTASDSTYASMTAAGTTCTRAADTAGYWVPTLVAPDGTHVKPAEMTVYYRNRPAGYGTVMPFPADFRMIAGNPTVASSPVAYWTCENESDTSLATRKTHIPNCGTSRIVTHVFFPTCWDGVHVDVGDHRSHMVYAANAQSGAITNISNVAVCPPSHPVKLPQIDLRVAYPVRDGTGYRFADGQLLPHADFWNTWQQGALVTLVRDCLHLGQSC